MGELTEKKSDRDLLLLAILFFVFQTVCLIFNYRFNLSFLVESVIMAVICFVIYGSYHSHNKNVMKPILGAALAILLYYSIESGFNYFLIFDAMVEYYEGSPAIIFYMIVRILKFVVLIALNVMHYVINASHHSSPNKIKLNKVFFLIYLALLILQAVSLIMLYVGDANQTISSIMGTISDGFMVGMVIIIENNLDEFRLLREAKASE